MKEGGLVPSVSGCDLFTNSFYLSLSPHLSNQDITVALLKAAMISNSSPVGYLIDGFPRDLEVGDKLFKEQV